MEIVCIVEDGRELWIFADSWLVRVAEECLELWSIVEG